MEITPVVKGHFLRLYQLAMADGNFSKAEWEMLYRFGEERGISSDELDSILLSTTGEIEIPETLEQRIEYLYDFARMIWADRQILPEEVETLQKYCRKFDFMDENIEELSRYLLDSAKQGKSKQEILNELND